MYTFQDQNDKFTITKRDSDLKGTNRFESKGLLSKKQCEIVVNILHTFSEVGDGYDTGSPHTKNEVIKGLSMERLILLVHYGILNMEHLRMLLKITESAKEKIKDYFSIEEPLYFTYTHFVCRTSLKGLYMGRNLLFVKNNI